MRCMRWKLRFSLVAAMAALTGCGTACLQVSPTAFVPSRATEVRPRSIGLYIDPDIAAYRTIAATHAFPAGPGHYAVIEVTYPLGDALAQTIGSTIRRHFRETLPAESPTKCSANNDGLIVVSFAKQPEISIRWVQRAMSEVGGATAELTLSAAARTCDGKPVWRGIAVGYGTADKPASGNPSSDQFELAVNAALADLSANLDAALTKADLSGLRAQDEKPPR